LHHARSRVFDDHVRPDGKFVHKVDGSGLAQIDCQAFFAAIQVGEICTLAAPKRRLDADRIAFRRFDLYDFGAQIG